MQVVANLHLMASSAPGSSDGEPRHGAAADATPVVAGPDGRTRATRSAWRRVARLPRQYPPGHRGERHRAVGGEDAETGEPPPRTGRDAGAWLMFAGLGFVVGQLASSILLVVVAAVTGHASTDRATGDATGPTRLGRGDRARGSVVRLRRCRRPRQPGPRHRAASVRDMGLEVRPWDARHRARSSGSGPDSSCCSRCSISPWSTSCPHLDQRLKEPAQHLTGGFPGSDLAVIAFLTVVVVPVIEETFFRGLVLRGLLRVCQGARAGASASAWPRWPTGSSSGWPTSSSCELLGLAAFGAVLALMAYKFRRLGPGIFAHGTFNLLAILSVAGVLH